MCCNQPLSILCLYNITEIIGSKCIWCFVRAPLPFGAVSCVLLPAAGVAVAVAAAPKNGADAVSAVAFAAAPFAVTFAAAPVVADAPSVDAASLLVVLSPAVRAASLADANAETPLARAAAVAVGVAAIYTADSAGDAPGIETAAQNGRMQEHHFLRTLPTYHSQKWAVPCLADTAAECPSGCQASAAARSGAASPRILRSCAAAGSLYRPRRCWAVLPCTVAECPSGWC